MRKLFSLIAILAMLFAVSPALAEWQPNVHVDGQSYRHASFNTGGDYNFAGGGNNSYGDYDGIGQKGIPEDVKVIPVSRLARESKRSELDIVASLKRNGYLMMTLQVFTQALDKTKSEILDGSLSLPIKISEITKQIIR